MKRLLLSVALLSIPLAANAAWIPNYSSVKSTSSDSISEGASVWMADPSYNPDWPFYVTYAGQAGKFHTFYISVDKTGSVESLPDNGATVYNGALTDEQCSSQYAGSYSVSFPADATDTTYISAGACTLYSVPDSETGTDIDVCTYSDDGSTMSCFGDWDSISTGDVNTVDFSQYPSGSAADSVQQSDEVPDYLTPTDNPSSCPTGSMSAGGVSYCVDTSSTNVTDLGGSPFGSGGGSGDGSGDGDGDGDGSGDGDGETDGQCDPETDGECEGESTECLPGMSCYVPTDAQVEAKFFDYFPGSVDNTQVTEYDASDFELDGEYESGLTSGSCPAPVPVTLALGGNSHTFEITFEFFCQFALLIRGLVLASCSFLAANIIYRGVVTLV